MDKKKAMVIGAFLGDALSLGPHWIYDVAELQKNFADVGVLHNPPAKSYHPTKKKGEFTHYGDQMFVFLHSLADKNGFDLQDWADKWRALFENYKGYIDHATKGTLQNFEDGKGPTESGVQSTDFSPVGRVACLVYMIDDEEILKKAVVDCVKMTHTSQEVIDSAVFFALVCRNVLAGRKPVDAMKELAVQFDTLKDWIDSGLEAVDKDSIEATQNFGSSCAVTGAFPSTVQAIAKYQDNLLDGLKACVAAGGDNAARASVFGMVAAAHKGLNGMENVAEGMTAYGQILRLLS
jgi:ADP-ribosylglycohydrolase